jgi:two-component system, LytTR family, response regulator
MRVILIDDEPKALENLEILLNKNHPEVQIVGKVSDSLNALEEISKHQPDLIFTDINMPNLDGIRLTSVLTSELPLKVFLTAYDQFTMEAIKNRAFDYLLKPIDILELKRTIDKAKQYFEHNKKSIDQNDRITLTVASGLIYCNVNDILYFAAEGSYTKVVCSDTKYLVSKNLREFEKIVKPKYFIRCHKSFLVNKSKVRMFKKSNGFQLIMINGDAVDVSKSAKDELLEFLK